MLHSALSSNPSGRGHGIMDSAFMGFMLESI